MCGVSHVGDRPRSLLFIATAWIAFHAVLISWSPAGMSAEAAITFNGAKCGNKFCSVAQFCNKHDNQCDDCSNICDQSTHNFDMGTCTQQCQDYLHNVRYASSSHHSEELGRLQTQLNLILALLCIVLLLLAISHGVRLVRWCRGRGIVSSLLRKLKVKKKQSQSEKMAPEDLTHANPNTQSPKVQLRNAGAPRNHPQLQLNRESTVFSIDGASTIHTVSTPISTRYPAEDSTLGYYDNAAMAVTPTIPERPKTNSSAGF